MTDFFKFCLLFALADQKDKLNQRQYIPVILKNYFFFYTSTSLFQSLNLYFLVCIWRLSVTLQRFITSSRSLIATAMMTLWRETWLPNKPLQDTFLFLGNLSPFLMSVYRPSIDDDLIITEGNWGLDSPAKDRFQKINLLRVRSTIWSNVTMNRYIHLISCKSSDLIWSF